MADAWVVYGQTGEYSDHREWLVCVYVGEGAEERATRHADRAAARVKERETEECSHGAPLSRWCDDCCDATPDPRTNKAFREWMGDLDPRMRNYDTTADYCALPVPIRARVPAAPPREETR
jgi:hypothetical protein